MKKLLMLLIVCAAVALVGAGAFVWYVNSGGPFSGRVTHVQDGDTITVERWNSPVKVRLAHIDSPELKQPFGPEARDFVKQRCMGKVVHVTPSARKDLYGRAIGDVSLQDHTCLNESIVENGFAWCYQRGTPADHNVRKLEKDAQSHKRGLWSREQPTAPWDFRKHKHSWFESFLPFLCPENASSPTPFTVLELLSAKKLMALVVMGFIFFFPLPKSKTKNLSSVSIEFGLLAGVFVLMLGIFLFA